MIIDFHTHLFPKDIAEKTLKLLGEMADVAPATDGSAADMLRAMNEAGVDLAVIVPVVTKPSQFEGINLFARKLNEIYGGRLLSFGGIHPDSEDYITELNLLKEWGFRGIKLHPDYQGVMIDDERYKRIIRYADELGMIILTHAGIDVGKPDPIHCPPDKMRKVLDEIKPKKMVLGHYGGWKQWEEVYEHLAGTDVYLDTAFTLDYIDEKLFLRILKKHGFEKVLFASDSPWSDMGSGVQMIRSLPIPEAEKEAILGQNAMRLLAL